MKAISKKESKKREQFLFYCEMFAQVTKLQALRHSLSLEDVSKFSSFDSYHSLSDSLSKEKAQIHKRLMKMLPKKWFDCAWYFETLEGVAHRYDELLSLAFDKKFDMSLHYDMLRL